MKDLKTILVVILIVVLAGTATRMLVVQYRVSHAPADEKVARVSELPPPPAPPVMEPTVVTEPLPEKKPASVENAPPPMPETNITPRPASPPVPPSGVREERRDPLARVALSYVGADPDAEAYWVEAIFDPNLSDQEREDLMEDLNEEGLSDPRQPGPEDLPLILNRLAIIEQVAPNADLFMLEHLAEAYKDLLNLLKGQPPR